VHGGRQENTAVTDKHLTGVGEDNFSDIYKEDFLHRDGSTVVVCAMFTPDSPRFFQCADRLARSCEKYELPYRIYKVPEVHKSLSPSGTDNLSFTKVNFIYSNLMRFPDKNVLCLDVDIFFADYPEQIVQISNSGYDFAIYNWLNDEHNEAYLPMSGKLEAGNRYSDFYIFSHSINYLSTEQLICSGGVQFYRNSPEAKHLLKSWEAFLAGHSHFAEDQCLDYVYNNFILESVHMKPFWLDKSYMRFPWWPHVKPVIMHPGLLSSRRNPRLNEMNDRKRFYPERCRKNESEFIFPPDCIIDTRQRLLLKYEGNLLVESRPIDQEFWIYPEDVGFEQQQIQ
jgi:hypothetical protein